ncbi:sensor domain-containing diguanylate cyclase [Oceaniglobus roseus]|uniref:sensor domain-containing diguanylate cyclase n=1 Tax=Oceaniglobus roseus TaxID=1737570 RepID=UPI000C7F0AFD|nr:sensor domain-containing diguanylate cyclase [Kandeliimicrobium roseum]
MNDLKLNDEAGRLRALMRYSVLDTPPEEKFESIVELVKQTLNVPMCAVTFIDRDRQWIKAERGVGGREMPRSLSFCSHAIKRAEPFVVPDATTHPLFSDNALVTGAPFIRSYLGIPLQTSDGYQIGSLCVIDTRPREFAEAEIALLSRFASLVVENLELRMIATTDALTGLRTRRDWQEQVRREIALSARSGRPLSVAIMDIDHFKAVNDTYGHRTGDLLLSEVARVLLNRLRATDLVGRLGGEEFAVALPETTADEAREVVERVRLAVARIETSSPEAPTVRCTISGGIAQLQDGETLDALCNRADHALYTAKGDGRNRLACALPQGRTKEICT